MTKLNTKITKQLEWYCSWEARHNAKYSYSCRNTFTTRHTTILRASKQKIIDKEFIYIWPYTFNASKHTAIQPILGSFRPNIYEESLVFPYIEQELQLSVMLAGEQLSQEQAPLNHILSIAMAPVSNTPQLQSTFRQAVVLSLRNHLLG